MGKQGKAKKKAFTSSWTIDESLQKFNEHYGTSYCFDEKEIDLTSPPNGVGFYLARDLNRLKFNDCEKLVLNLPFDQIKCLSPKMPALKHLGLVYGDMSRVFLRLHAFKNIEELDLTGNNISKAGSVLITKKLAHLKKLILTLNPICQDEEEMKKAKEELAPIEVIFE